MKPYTLNVRLILGIVCAHFLIYLSFHFTSVFWYLYTAAILFCICYAVGIGKLTTAHNQTTFKNILLGVLSGIGIFGLFYVGTLLIDFFHFKALTKDITQLYKTYSPELLFHYIVLFIFIIPGEEIFWRGYVQTKIDKMFKATVAVPLAVLMYALPLVYSGNNALILAGVVAGLAWSLLYQWKKSLSLVIASHLAFDLLLLIIFPLI
ncbi:MAG: lysostaphin resistance A-like protein [Bacillus sp. (in: firmicutes)]